MNKSRQPRGRTDVSAEKLRSIATMIRGYAEIYLQAADAIDEAGAGEISVTGIDSLERRALTELRGNALTVLKTAFAQRDAEALAKVAESKTQFAIDDTVKPKKKGQKAKQKDE